MQDAIFMTLVDKIFTAAITLRTTGMSNGAAVKDAVDIFRRTGIAVEEIELEAAREKMNV